MPANPAVRSNIIGVQTPRGFTLAELLAVLAILAMLVVVSLGVVEGVRNGAACTRAKGELAVLSLGLEAYRSQFGSYPQMAGTPEDLFLALTGRIGPDGGEVHGQNLLARLAVNLRYPASPDATGNAFEDPWGHPYEYVYFTRQDPDGSVRRGYVLYSLGARTTAERLPSRDQVVPATSGSSGGVVAASAANAKNLYAER